MKKTIFFPLLLLLSITFSSCKIQPVVPTGVQDVKFGSIDPLKGNVSIDLGLKINNPNKFSITVYGMDLEITVAGVPMGKVSITDKFKIEKEKEDVYRVKANTSITDLFSNLPKILNAIKKKQSDVQVKGFIRIGSGIFKHTFPVNVNQDKVATTG